MIITWARREYNRRNSDISIIFKLVNSEIELRVIYPTENLND